MYNFRSFAKTIRSILGHGSLRSWLITAVTVSADAGNGNGVQYKYITVCYVCKCHEIPARRMYAGFLIDRYRRDDLLRSLSRPKIEYNKNNKNRSSADSTTTNGRVFYSSSKCVFSPTWDQKRFEQTGVEWLITELEN